MGVEQGESAKDLVWMRGEGRGPSSFIAPAGGKGKSLSLEPLTMLILSPQLLLFTIISDFVEVTHARSCSL